MKKINKFIYIYIYIYIMFEYINIIKKLSYVDGQLYNGLI